MLITISPESRFPSPESPLSPTLNRHPNPTGMVQGGFPDKILQSNFLPFEYAIKRIRLRMRKRSRELTFRKASEGSIPATEAPDAARH